MSPQLGNKVISPAAPPAALTVSQAVLSLLPREARFIFSLFHFGIWAQQWKWFCQLTILVLFYCFPSCDMFQNPFYVLLALHSLVQALFQTYFSHPTFPPPNTLILRHIIIKSFLSSRQLALLSIGQSLSCEKYYVGRKERNWISSLILVITFSTREITLFASWGEVKKLIILPNGYKG